MMSSTAAADIALAQDFLRARYKGTESLTSVDLDATFFSEIDIDIK